MFYLTDFIDTFYYALLFFSSQPSAPMKRICFFYGEHPYSLGRFSLSKENEIMVLPQNFYRVSNQVVYVNIFYRKITILYVKILLLGEVYNL